MEKEGDLQQTGARVEQRSCYFGSFSHGEAEVKIGWQI
jgi:hypothetical protein